MTDTVQRLMALADTYAAYSANEFAQQQELMARAALEAALREQDAEIERLRAALALRGPGMTPKMLAEYLRAAAINQPKRSTHP